MPPAMFSALCLVHRDQLRSLASPIAISSRDLSIAQVVAVARHVAQIELTTEATDLIQRCSQVINKKLAQGDVIYGVNTGFGGSADTRTEDVGHLQQSVFTHLMFGILADGKPQSVVQVNGSGTIEKHGNNSSQISSHGTPRVPFEIALPLNDPEAATCMPESWARATMVVRLNSLAGGASGVRVCIAESLVQLLNKDVVPRIPIRGSISASGDLSPLSYVGAIMQGKTTATAFSGSRRTEGSRKVVRADAALAAAAIQPIEIQPKEGLAIVNGTAVSAGIAALALHECMNLAAFSQVLTAMSVEALLGTDESFEPFIAQVRPHPGQVDSARSIFAFLKDSKLVVRNDESRLGQGQLRQDRYSIRTASQWIGPVLEDFMLAHEQITTELNSVTDNPLIDASSHPSRIYHGGNFQAKVVTSAVEKLRSGLQSIGRMLFTQGTEIINPAMNRGLPPNLASDEPSESYLFKGIDVMMAALTSELGFLANPVGSHVQTAEMGNQALNSLALVSVRYTLEAVDVLSQLSAACLLALCQALDLRAMELAFQESFSPLFWDTFDRCFLRPYDAELSNYLGSFGDQESRTKIQDSSLRSSLWTQFIINCENGSTLDSADRYSKALKEIGPMMLELADHSNLQDGTRGTAVRLMNDFIREASQSCINSHSTVREKYRQNADATPILGKAATRLYHFVRKDLGIPFLGEENVSAKETSDGVSPSLGTHQTAIYEAIRSGRLYEVVMACFEEAAEEVGA